MIKKRRSFIIGIKGQKLSKKEIIFIKKYCPWGVILFSRNIKNLNQIKRLVDSIKNINKDYNFPILIDQEGGRVSRIEKLISSSVFSGSYFEKKFLNDRKNISYYLDVYIDQITHLFRNIGININTCPLLDLKIKGSSSIIGNRAFSNNPNTVYSIGKLFIQKLHKNKIASVIKHIPGHGLAKSDSHFNTPVVNKTLKFLKKNDFAPFKKQKSLFAMTAHIIFKKIDKENTVTHSKKMIQIIRNEIKFKNIIISDDISMKALKHSIAKNTEKAFKAGCNLVLHCNGKMSEMELVAKNSPKLDNFLMKKTLEFYKIIEN